MNEPEELMSTIIDYGGGYFSEMVTVSGGFNSVKLSVWEDEGMIPHFHFYKGIAPESGVRSGRSGGGCICFTEPKYFTHGAHTENLNRSEAKGLIPFLQRQHPVGCTNLAYLISLWNENNYDRPQLPMDLPIPEYTHNMPSIT